MITQHHTHRARVAMALSLMLGLLATTGVADIAATLTPQSTSRFIYEPFDVLLQVTTEHTPETPQVTSGGGFSVLGITPLPPAKGQHRFLIEILPEKAGTLTLPPITVRANDAHAETSALRLSISTPRHAHEMALTTSLNHTMPYVDQAVTMRLNWNSTLPFTRCMELTLDHPILLDANWSIYPVASSAPEKQRIGLPVSGQRAIGTLAQSGSTQRIDVVYMLVPRTAGDYAWRDTRLQGALVDGRRPANPYPSYFDNHFFRSPDPGDGFERIYLSSPVPGVTVQPLPEAGRSARYVTVAAGLTVESHISPTNTVVGAPMLLTLTLGNLPFSDHITELPAAAINDVGPEFSVTQNPLRTSSTPDTKSFTYVLRPLRSGVDMLPALAFQYFDPVKKQFQTLRTQALAVTVSADGDQNVYRPYMDKDVTAPERRKGIRANRNESAAEMTTYACLECAARYAWAFWLLPPALWLALRPWFRRRDRCRSTPAYARAVHAARRFRRSSTQDADAAWTHYLADRFDLSADAVTFKSVSQKLSAEHCPAALIDAVRERFDQIDAKHYAPDDTPADRPVDTAALVRQLESATRILVLAFCLITPMHAQATSPESRFQELMELRTHRPDEAGPRFAEAALDFDAMGQYLNAGNSWFFAGESGRALASYRAAQRLRPFDDQINESIDFIKVQYAGSIEATERPGSRVAQRWHQLSRWHPTLLVGVLTFIYVAGWVLFLTARFMGTRVPRLAWGLFALVGLLFVSALLHGWTQPDRGVVISSCEARLGPGYAYDVAYDSPVPPAAEFDWLDIHKGWVHARLPNGNTAWIPDSACTRVR